MKPGKKLPVLSPLEAAAKCCDGLSCRANIRQIIFAARYGPHLGNYMMHCHNVVHEDHDMLRAFLVRRYSAPSASDRHVKALQRHCFRLACGWQRDGAASKLRCPAHSRYCACSRSLIFDASCLECRL